VKGGGNPGNRSVAIYAAVNFIFECANGGKSLIAM
jgi:hypothetical protein